MVFVCYCKLRPEEGFDLDFRFTLMESPSRPHESETLGVHDMGIHMSNITYLLRTSSTI